MKKILFLIIAIFALPFVARAEISTWYSGDDLSEIRTKIYANDLENAGNKVVSGVVSGGNIVFTRADSTTFTVVASSFLDNTDAQTISALSLNGSTNVLTVTISGGNSATVDLSGLVGGGLSDAPSDGTTYARKDGAWVAVTGGALDSDATTAGQVYVSTAASTYSWTTYSALKTAMDLEVGTDFLSPTAINTLLADYVETADLTTISDFVASMMGATDLPTWLGLTGQDDIQTSLGIAAGAVNFGTFTGSTLTDSSTLKALLQELETAIESVSVGSPVVAAPTYSDQTCVKGTFAFGTSHPILWCKDTNTWDYQETDTDGVTLVWAGWDNPTPSTYSLTLTLTDTTGTGSTWTVDGITIDVDDLDGSNQYTWTGLDSSTQAVTFDNNTTETSVCTGNDSGSDPNYVVDMSSADVDDLACTVSGGCSGTESIGETTAFTGFSAANSGSMYAWHVGQISGSGRDLASINIYDSDSSSGNVYVGIYSGTTSAPSTLVVDLGEIADTGTAEWKSYLDSSDTALSAGVEYWVAIAPRNDSQFRPVYEESGTMTSYIAAHTYGPLPSTFPSGTADTGDDFSVYLTAGCQ